MTRAAGAFRKFHDAVVTGRCIDCGDTFTGELGVRMIFPTEGPSLEIVIAHAKRNEVHAIARVEVYLIPIVYETVVPLPPAGEA
jgi:hypothetical protein